MMDLNKSGVFLKGGFETLGTAAINSMNSIEQMGQMMAKHHVMFATMSEQSVNDFGKMVGKIKSDTKTLAQLGMSFEEANDVLSDYTELQRTTGAFQKMDQEKRF